MSPSEVPSTQPQLTLEPSHASKRITNISQWVSVFTIFVSVYSEKITNHTAQLMKYCEVIRDLALNAGDWHWYDEQSRYLRQSAPDQYLWDQIHWELWLRASNPFRKLHTQTPTSKRFHSQLFPKGTCWAFQVGNTAQVASSSTCVLNVVENTREGSASLRQPNPDLHTVQKVNEMVLMYRVLHSTPVTPISVDRLEFLLDGYDIALKQFLVDGFQFGFHINFVGERFTSECHNL